MVDYFKCTADVAVVFEPSTPKAERDQQLEKIQTLLKETLLSAEVKVLKRKGVRQSIIQESKHADLIIMGGRSGEFLSLLFGQSLTQEITEQSASPVLWVNEYEEQPSFWAQLLKSFEKEEEEHHE
jgi:nucleotide-binding universal stress UspA family protein